MRIKPLVVLSLVCSLSQAADTVASLGDSIKATQFVTAVDHTKLVNGTTEVTANTDGTASIVVQGTEKWVFTPTSGSMDRRSQSGIGYYSGANSDALLYRITFYEDITGFSHGDTTVADVEFLRREDSGVTNLLWKSPVQFLAVDLESVMKFQGNGVVKGFSPDRYASNGYTIDGIPIESDFSTMMVGTDMTYLIYAEGSFVYFELAGPLDWSSSVRVSHETEGSTKTIATIDQLPTVPANVSAFNNDANYTSGQVATNIAKQIIHDAVSGVNTDIQTAEDARVALTNLITILKNL